MTKSDLTEEKYPKYEECKKCNYYEDDGLYEDPNSCLWTCKHHKRYVKTRSSKMFTDNKDAQVAFREYCELIAYEKGYKQATRDLGK